MIKIRKDLARLTLVFFVNLLFSFFISAVYKGYLVKYQIPKEVEQLITTPDILNMSMIILIGILIVISAVSLGLSIDNILIALISPIPTLLIHTMRTLRYINFDLGFIDIKVAYLIIFYGLLIAIYILKMLFFCIYWCFGNGKKERIKNKHKVKENKKDKSIEDDIFEEYIVQDKDNIGDNNENKISFQEEEEEDTDIARAGKFL